MTNGKAPDYPAWITAARRERFNRRLAWGGIIFIVGLVLGALLGGCAHFGTLAPRTGQEQAVYIIWVEAYGRTDRPPLVRWIEGSALDCTDPQSGKAGFPQFTEQGEATCREGLTMSPLEVMVAWHGELSFSETALAHELLHAALIRRGIFLDHHQRPDFFPAVDAANELVRAAGR